MSRVLFAISWISVSSTLMMACYFLFGVTWWSSAAVFVVSAVIARLAVRKIVVPTASVSTVPAGEKSRMGWNMKMLVLVWAYAPIALLRTGAAVVTPWHTPVVVLVVLLLYGTGTWYLLRRGNGESRIVLFLHGLATFGLAQYVFVHGYGFDPAVHEAALREVVAHGQVLPLQFLYSCYYAVLSGLHLVTGIPVALLNTWVVPVGAAVVQAVVAPWAFEVAWGASADTARRAAVLLSIVSVPVFTLSTPWSASVLLALIAVLLAPLLERRTYLIFGCLIVAIAALHPLMGAPVAVVFACIVIWQKRGVGAAVAITVVAIVGLFGWLRVRAGVPFFEQATTFPRALQLVVNTYGVRVLAVVGAVVLLVQSRAWIPTTYRRIVASLGAGMLVSAVVLYWCVPAPLVGATDKFEYAWRLLLGALVVVSPVIAIAIAQWKDRPWYWTACAAALMLSWFGMYPGLDSTQRVVSDADMRAAYALPMGVVLSDQVFAQAGLKAEGFPSRYPVDAWSEPARRSEIMLHTSVVEAIRGLADPIVVVHEYWYRATAIEAEARAAGLELLNQDDLVRVFGVVNARGVR